VAPIVRSHHEKWNGEGYPDGLRGEAIPMGARILSAVDCLDALASDRQYRRALPLDQALAVVVSESGKSYDPRVVEILARRCAELEQRARGGDKISELAKLSTGVKVERGEAPAAGFEQGNQAPAPADQPKPVEFLASIASARQEVQSLFELAQDLGQSLSLSETLSVVASRLRRMIPFDGLAIWVLRDDRLVPECVTGEDQQLFLSLEIPMGQGLSGWVAENRRPILNGNPSVEPGYLNDPSRFSKLSSALAVPLESPNGVLGVLALYHARRDAFSRDQLRILMAVSAKLAVSIENAQRFREAETSATTDYLTGLPNARSLFLHLDAEVARCRRASVPLAVLVCDLDGFKSVNDRFGHLAGNRLLSLVGAGLREKCRAYDYVARMGGDEFVIVLPGLSGEALERKKTEYEEVAVQAGFTVCGEHILSLSIGDAALGTGAEDAEELLAEADRKMYRRKQARRRPRLEAVAPRQASEPKAVNA
jgi:diguanylate cyclase (GGDEF)-like protein